jgi:hypothetical protein
MRHIAIGGLSFCGSTVTSYILGSLEGCGTVGESHWLVDNTSTGAIIYCSHCGPACAYWTEPFRDALKADPTNWYIKLADKLSVDTLISSDKTPFYLDRLDPRREYDFLVLYKPPELHARSHANVIQRNGAIVEISKYLDYWSTFYERLMKRYPVSGRVVFVNSQVLYERAGDRILTLAKTLDLPIAGNPLSYWTKVHHAVGGNFNPYSWIHSDLDRLKIAPLTIHPLSDAHLREVDSHARAMATFANLESRSLRF